MENITLAEGIARAGGGIDTITNLAAIYLFRYEPGFLARDVLSVDRQAVNTKFVNQRMDSITPESSVPVLYRVDLTQADGYFMAQNVRLRHRDIVMLATAEAAQFLKLMTVVRSISGTYYDLTRSTNN
jgi:polysaccharide export outer membrane protein